MVERTLAIVKPDAVERRVAGRIISRIEASGLKIVAGRWVWLTREQAARFYAVHRERPFFEDLTRFMSSGPAVVMVLEGDGAIGRWRDLMGPTDPKVAMPDTLRREFGTDVEKNAVHGSDAADTAAAEIAFFFRSLDMVGCAP